MLKSIRCWTMLPNQAFIEQYDYIKRILKIGIAFQDKSVLTFHRIDDLSNNPLSELEYSRSEISFDDKESDEEDHKNQKGKKRYYDDSSEEEPKKKKQRTVKTSSPTFFAAAESPGKSQEKGGHLASQLSTTHSPPHTP